jgi:uncharacterized protein YbaP (TraB family)
MGSAAGETALRLRGRRRVETAVWTLQHETTGRTVTLVGIMHIGNSRYFSDLSGVLADLAGAGAEVHVEGVAQRDEESATDWERARLTQADGWGDAEETGDTVALLRLESQGAQLELPPGYRNVDLSRLELLRRVGWEAYRRLLAPPPETAAGRHLSPALRATLRFELRHRRALERLRSLRARNRRVNRVVIDERNETAFAGGAQALARGDVVLVWGADHLPGLAARFRAGGYRLTGEAWFEACTI